MATLKDQIDGVCKELKVTVKEGGLIAQVKAAAELCGLEYTTLKDTAAALVKEVLGESEDAPAADGDGDAVLTKATHSHHCFCVEGNPDICREH